MTCDPPFLASEGWLIPEVASFKEEGLVTQKDEKEKKESWKFVGSPGLLHEMQECWPLHHPEIVMKWSRL